jgi:glycosyltransferase involved in cell wall biosynthesis
MLSVVIPTKNSEEGLARTLASLVPAAAEGVVREVIVADAGSTDGTRVVAEAAGCLLVDASGSWGERIGIGVDAMRRAPWLMLLPPQVVLEGDWFRELAAFIERSERGGRAASFAASFRLEFDAYGFKARTAERAIALCSGWLGLPVPQQGLVMSRRLWDRVGAGASIADHVSLIGRIGRRHIHILRSSAVVISDAQDRFGVPSAPALAGHTLAALGLPGMALGARECLGR